MTRLKYIYTIIVKDLLESLQNKTILIVIMLPLAASLLFTLIDSSGVDKNFRLGIVEENSDSLYNFVEEQVENFIVLDFPLVENGLQQVKSGRLDALIVL
ncbi:MAG: ABC transporter permease, partial [Halanaerobiales bacterium]|nr:ABC transporter permease [Halanaerobiales bacterium]